MKILHKLCKITRIGKTLKVHKKTTNVFKGIIQVIGTEVFFRYVMTDDNLKHGSFLCPIIKKILDDVSF